MTSNTKSWWIALVLGLVAVVAPLQASEAMELPDVPESAYAQDAYDGDEPRVAKRLVVNADVVQPGDTVEVGVIFEMDPGWHIYWRDSGQGGMSTRIDFDASQGSPGPVQWPEPGLYHEAGGMIITFGYSDTVLLYSEVEIDDDATDSVELIAEPDYLVCEIDCIPGNAELSRTLDVDTETTAASDGSGPWFDEAIDAVPRSSEETGVDIDVRYSHVPIDNPDDFRIEIAAVGCVDENNPDCVDLGDVPDEPADALVYEKLDTIDLDVTRVSPHPNVESGWFIEIDGRASRDNPAGDGRLRGVLRLRDSDGKAISTNFDELFPRSESDEAQSLVVDTGDTDSAIGDESADDGTAPASPSDLSLLYVLLLAFLGGALLNLMPCVFPVLAVKVFAFVNLAHEERQNIYVHSATYTAGIVTSMMVLAAAVIGLQLVGTQVGWGFQFQEPGFIAAVGAVLVIFALNLFGVFEVTLNPGRLQDVADAPPSHRRSFGEGVLAVVLATPCSAPFLGTAVGFALASPPWVVALTFAVLGVGLAAPFVVLTLVPGARQILPKPGPWMNHFKQLLGFALLATTIWLVWLIGQMTGTDGIVRLLIFLLSCGLAAWLFGLVQFRSTRARRVGLAFAVAIVVGTGLATLHFEESEPDEMVETQDEAQPNWADWSRETVEAELEAGRPVFVNFTADWCITCKVNERNVLNQPEVLAAVDDYDVAMVMGDWTRRDDHIRSRLADFGKGGVPMYLVYSPEAPDDPQLLPEVLSEDRVIEALEDAAR